MTNKNITNEEINLVSQNMRLELFPADSFVLKEGEVGDRFYVVLKGVCKVLRASSEDDPYLSLPAIFNIGYSQQQQQFVTGTSAQSRVKLKKRTPTIRQQSTTKSLVSFSGGESSELELLLMSFIKHYEMDLIAF